MKCPHCKNKIGLFSKALNKFGKTKVCPKCEKTIELSINIKLIAFLAIPVFIAHLFVLKPMVIELGFSGKGIVGIWAVLLLIYATELKSAES